MTHDIATRETLPPSRSRAWGNGRREVKSPVQITHSEQRGGMGFLAFGVFCKATDHSEFLDDFRKEKAACHFGYGLGVRSSHRQMILQVALVKSPELFSRVVWSFK